MLSVRPGPLQPAAGRKGRAQWGSGQPKHGLGTGSEKLPHGRARRPLPAPGGLPSSLRSAVPEAALVAASPCPSRARSPPPPRGPGEPQRPATPRSMPMKKTVDRLPGQEKRKKQTRKKHQAMGAVNPSEPMLAEQPRPPRCLLPPCQQASLPV